MNIISILGIKVILSMDVVRAVRSRQIRYNGFETVRAQMRQRVFYLKAVNIKGKVGKVYIVHLVHETVNEEKEERF